MRNRSRASGRDFFEILVRENAAMLTAYLRASVDDSSAIDDLFQETWIVVWKRIDDYDRDRPFGPWLRGIARKLILAHYRTAATQPRWCTPDVLEMIDRHFEALAARTGDTFRDRVERILDCITQLSDRLRQVIELAYGRGMSLKDVATAIDEQEDTVRKRAQRARVLLHECLQAGDTR